MAKLFLNFKGLLNTSRTVGNAKLKFSEISTLQNREIQMQRKYNVSQYRR